MFSLRRSSSTILVAITATIGLTRQASAAKPEIEACLDAYERGQALRDGRKLIEARKELLACARDVCPSTLRKDCSTWIEEVDRSLGSVVFRLVDARDRDVTEAEISIDGQTVVKRVDGWAVVVEPGPHEVRVAVAGHPPLVQNVVVAEGEKNRAVLFRLADVTRGEQPSAHVLPPATERDAVPAGAWISGGAAVVAFGAFAYLGITGTSELSRLHDECGVSRSCSKSEVDGVKTTLIAGDIAGIVGVVAVGVLTYFLVDHFSSRSSARPRGAAAIVF